MIKYCKDCKYWEHHQDASYKIWDTCSVIELVEYNATIPEDGFAIYAEAAEDSWLTCGVITGPLFGCTKFEAKEDDQILQGL